MTLEIREVWAEFGDDVSDLTDDQLLRASVLLIERYGTLSPGGPVSPAASMRAGVLGEIRAEGGTPAFGQAGAHPPPTKPLKPHPSTYKQAGWRSIVSELREPIPPAELLAFEAAHPDDDNALKWVEIRQRWRRSPAAYTAQRLRAAESAVGQATYPVEAARILAHRDALRDKRRG